MSSKAKTDANENKQTTNFTDKGKQSTLNKMIKPFVFINHKEIKKQMQNDVFGMEKKIATFQENEKKCFFSLPKKAENKLSLPLKNKHSNVFVCTQTQTPIQLE